MKKRIVSAWPSLKVRLPVVELWIKKHKGYFIVLVIFFVFPFFFLDHLYEFPTLIVSIYGNEYLGIAAWIASGNPFWQAAIAIGCITSFTLILLYFGFDIVKSIFGFFWKKKKKKNNLPKKKNDFFQKIIARLEKRGLWGIILAYFLCLIPIIPFLIPMAVVFPLAEKKKYALPLLIGLNFLRAFLIVSGMYFGFSWLFFK